MGNVVYAYITHPDTAPDFTKPPTFDSTVGFKYDRVERNVIATRAVLDRAGVPLERRDYCVDFFLKLLRCRDQHFPRTVSSCHEQKHDYEQCEYEDYVLRMKEYEREKRLKERAKRIAEKQSKEMLGE